MLKAVLLAVLVLLKLANGSTHSPHFTVLCGCGSTLNDGGFIETAFNSLNEMKASYDYDFTYGFQLCTNSETISNSSETDHFIFMGFPVQEFFSQAQYYTNKRFTAIDFVPDPLYENSQAFVFAEDQGGFVAGALAGLQTIQKSVGGIFGVPIPVVKKFRNGFISGVEHTCPECNIHTQYIWSFSDLNAGANVASFMVQNKSTDVIFTAAGGTGVGAMIEGANHDTWIIGVDTDQYVTVFGGTNETTGKPVNHLGTKVISSALKRVGEAIKKIIEEHFSGKFRSGEVVQMDYSLNGIGLAPCHAACNDLKPGILSQIQTIEAKFSTGQLSTGVDPVTGNLLMDRFYGDGQQPNVFTPVNTFGASPERIQDAAGIMTMQWGDPVFFMFGGNTESSPYGANQLWSFNVNSMSWRLHTEANLLLGSGHNLSTNEIGEFPEGRSGAVMSTISNGYQSRLVLHGGNQKGNRLSDLWMYTPPSAFVFSFDTWRNLLPIGPSPSARDGHSAAAGESKNGMQDCAYFFGGKSSYGSLLSDLWVLRITDDDYANWTELCKTCTIKPQARQHHTLTFHNGMLYLFGGEGLDQNILSDFWVFNTSSFMWEQLQSPQLAKASHTAVLTKIIPPGFNERKEVIAFVGGKYVDGLLDFQKLGFEYYILEEKSWIFVMTYNPEKGQCASKVVENGFPIKFLNRYLHTSFNIPSFNENRGDKIAVVGGRNDESGLLLDFHVFTPYDNDVIEEKNHNSSVRTFCLFLCAVSSSVALYFIYWIYRFRENPVIKASQLEFLLLTVFGTLLSSLAIIPVTVDDQYDKFGEARSGLYQPANIACVASLYLYTAGFAITFGSLFSKIWRISVLFTNMDSGKIIKIPNKMLFMICFGLVFVEVGLIALWQLNSSIKYTRIVKETDKFGNIVESAGMCTSEESTGYLFSLIGLNILIMLFGSIICYRASYINSTFSEGKLINFALTGKIQVLAIAIPVVFMAYDHPTFRIFILSSVIFLDNMSIICFLFVPKVQGVRGGKGVEIVRSALQSTAPKQIYPSTAFTATSSMVSAMNSDRKTLPS